MRAQLPNNSEHHVKPIDYTPGRTVAIYYARHLISHKTLVIFFENNFGSTFCHEIHFIYSVSLRFAGIFFFFGSSSFWQIHIAVAHAYSVCRCVFLSAFGITDDNIYNAKYACKLIISLKRVLLSHSLSGCRTNGANDCLEADASSLHVGHLI